MKEMDILQKYLIISIIIFTNKMNNSQELAERRLFDYRNNLDFTPKRLEQSWTDQRIQQIKKKYQTTNKKPQWPGSQIRSKSMAQDKENQRKITRTQHKEQKKEIYLENPNIDYRSKGQNMTQSYKLGSKTNEKEVHSSFKIGNSNNNEGLSVSAFETSDHIYMKSALNQKFQAQSSQKINYQPSIRLNTDYGLGGKFRESNPKITKREINDHRIENIDKINSKIKHLLQCIEDCEQQERRITNASIVEMNRSHVERFNLDRSNISKLQLKNGPNRLQLQQTKIIQRRNKSSKHFQEYLNHYKEKLNERQSRFQVKNAVQNQSFILRASSCIEKKRKYQYSQEHREQTDNQNSGQIDFQINKFHQKIEELQQKKRKMNIQFKPFQYECSSIKNINKESQIFSSKFYQKFPDQRLKTQAQKPSSYFNKQIVQREKYGVASRKEERQNIQSKAIYRFVKDSVYPQKVNLRQSNARPSQSRKNTIQNLENDQKQSIVIQNIELNNSKTYDNDELRKKIGERMQSRKKMLQMIQSKISSQQEDILQYQNFINALCKQVCLDQELRNSKNWLSQYHNSAKYELIKSQLVKKGVHMREEQIYSEFMCVNDIQNDPFFSFRQQKYTVNTVVSSYLDSINFWQQKLLKSWNIEKVLKNQSLSVSLLKNEVSIEDIVRLINTHSGNFYRNRDVYLIFERIKKYLGIEEQDQLTLSQLKQVFGK